MKTRQRLMTILAAAFILSGSFPAFTVKADLLPEETMAEQDSLKAHDAETADSKKTTVCEVIPDNKKTTDDTYLSKDEETADDTDISENEETADDTDISENAPLPEMTTVPAEKTDSATEDDMDGAPGRAAEKDPDDILPDGPVSDITEESTEETSLLRTVTESDKETDFPLPDSPPMFRARIEFRQGSYIVTGTFTDFTPDITLVQPMYSLDGENWENCGTDTTWNLRFLDTDDPEKLKNLQEQPCLFSNLEPLKSYVAGETDRFYLKLRITRQNGLSYDTRSAVIERGGIRSLPEGTNCAARFSSSIIVRESLPTAPYRYRQYGRYQLTVSADATAEEISALLPDTLPVEIQLSQENGFTATGVVDCPVTWKPLSLPRLSAGESITIPDAAEEILVPGGTLLSTPLGIFRLDEPLSLNVSPSTDEVRLVLNVSPEGGNPTGVLREGLQGLEIAFHNKPTGATSIRAYMLAEGESEWTELSGLSLLKDLDQPSSASSGYALLLRNDQEPYRSYLTDESAGKTPVPFFISLKIEGGVYNDRQLVLAWPDIYEQLPDLPKIGGFGGNEGNAGAANMGDSTESGQRPNMPHITDTSHKEQQAAPAPENSDQKQQTTTPPLHSDPLPAISENQNSTSTDESGFDHPVSQSAFDQPPDLSQITPDTPGISAGDQENSRLTFASPTVQTVAITDEKSPVEQDATDMRKEQSVPILSNVKTAIEHAAENSRRLLFLLLVTAITAAGICIGAAACRAAGYNPFCKILGKLRKILRKQ